MVNRNKRCMKAIGICILLLASAGGLLFLLLPADGIFGFTSDLPAAEASAAKILTGASRGNAEILRLSGSFAGSIEDLSVARTVTFGSTKGKYEFKYERTDATHYTLEAWPSVPGKTGVRYFYVDQTGVVRWESMKRASQTSAAI